MALTYSSGGSIPQSVSIGDVNGDGKPDLVVANCGGTFVDCRAWTPSNVAVLLGNGDGTFQTAVTYSTGGTGGRSVAIADMNGDGKPDLVVANACQNSDCLNVAQDGSVGVLLGNGNGTFQAPVTYDSGGSNIPVVAAKDLNGDGKPDVAVTNTCLTSISCADGIGNVGVLINITPWPYQAFAQPPINADGSSVFSARRGVVPVKFTLTQNGIPTCTLPPATISVTRTAGGTVGPIAESIYSTPADNGSNFRIDPTTCQYVYNLATSSLGVGTYRVDISINGIVVGHAVFALQ